MEQKLTSRRLRPTGEFHFFWGKRDVTGLWMDFFSGLAPDKEKDCVALFTRKYGKKLDNNLI